MHRVARLRWDLNLEEEKRKIFYDASAGYTADRLGVYYQLTIVMLLKKTLFACNNLIYEWSAATYSWKSCFEIY